MPTETSAPRTPKPHPMATRADAPCAACGYDWLRPTVDMSDPEAPEYPVYAGCARCKHRPGTPVRTVRVHDGPDADGPSLREAPPETPDRDCWEVPAHLWGQYCAARRIAHNLAADIYARASRDLTTPTRSEP